jgi:peptidyl-tRNA hydrolase, PTH2 family
MKSMKQAIIVRKDLKMSCGKIAGQVAHASLRAYWATPKKMRDNWVYNFNEVKIVLKVQSEKELENIIERCDDEDIPYSWVFDEGKTQIEPNTLTAVGIGPCDKKDIEEVIGGLKLL